MLFKVANETEYPRNWKKIAELFPGKTDLNCVFQYDKYNKKEKGKKSKYESKIKNIDKMNKKKEFSLKTQKNKGRGMREKKIFLNNAKRLRKSRGGKFKFKEKKVNFFFSRFFQKKKIIVFILLIKNILFLEPWTNEEDMKVMELVTEYGPQKWTFIAEHLPGRIGKQCRERWHNHLNPKINKNIWGEEEEWILFTVSFFFSFIF